MLIESFIFHSVELRYATYQVLANLCDINVIMTLSIPFCETAELARSLNGKSCIM